MAIEYIWKSGKYQAVGESEVVRQLKVVVVDELPEVGSAGIIYIVPTEESGSGDIDPATTPKLWITDDYFEDFSNDLLAQVKLGDIIYSTDNDGYYNVVISSETEKCLRICYPGGTSDIHYEFDGSAYVFTFNEDVSFGKRLYKHTLSWDHGGGDIEVLSFINTSDTNSNVHQSWRDFKSNVLDKAVRLCDYYNPMSAGENLILLDTREVIINNSAMIAFCGICVGGTASQLIWQFGDGSNAVVATALLDQDITPQETIEQL